MKFILCALFSFLSLTVFAKEPPDSLQDLKAELKRIDSIESSLHYKTGTFTLQNGMATLTIPNGFKFLEAAEAKRVLEDVWGNLEGQAPLGMIFPESSNASFAEYAFIVEYQDMGYVKDDDADKINYTDLLKEMKEDAATSNEERKKQGLSTMDLVGWAANPYYDKSKKILYWAKEYKVEGSEEHTLNYDVRILGRKGVLVLQAVAGMSALDSVNKNIAPILSMVHFNGGHKYSDYDSKTDNVAAWTIGGLVAGKVLAKVGFFAIIVKFLKFILLGLVAIGGAIVKFFKRKKEPE
jgi:uncharacterized membrane-anchored protein